MKKLFFSLVALICATMSYAQSTMVATLSHNEKVSMFYGANALRDAMNVAVSGDIINLSGGAFQAADITKAVTLRGTGINNADPTYIMNSFEIRIPIENNGKHLSMEGIRCTDVIRMRGYMENPVFMKCQFVKFEFINTTNTKNALYSNCIITDMVYMEGGCNSSIQFINSYLNAFENYSGSIIFCNCIIRPLFNNRADLIQYSQLNNCVIFSGTNETVNSLPNSTIAKNCVGIGSKVNYLFNNSAVNTGCKISTFTEMFKTFKGNYSDDQTFELTEVAKTKFTGTDGTQVGIYGGLVPYNPSPSYPQITKMNVANKTTADGKLSVEIEVSATE